MDLRAHHKPTFDNISAEKEQNPRRRDKRIRCKRLWKRQHRHYCKKAGVSVGSLYKYFENKQDLFLTVVQHSISQMEELLNVLAVSDEDILIKVEKIIRTIQSSSRESAVLVKLYNAMTAENDPRFASQFAYEMESMTSRIYRIAIAEGQKTATLERISTRLSLRLCLTISLCPFSFHIPVTIIGRDLKYMSGTILNRVMNLSLSRAWNL